MINLLSNGRKDDIRAARSNVILLRYIGIVVLAIAFIVGIFYVSYTILTTTMKSNETILTSNDLKADVYSGTKKEVDALSAKLSEAKSILNQEVRYSQLLPKLGQIMPSGTILGPLKLDNTSFVGTPVDIIAYAKTANEATALQSQFRSSPLFSQVVIKGTEENSGVKNYPVKISLSVVFNKAGIK